MIVPAHETVDDISSLHKPHDRVDIEG